MGIPGSHLTMAAVDPFRPRKDSFYYAAPGGYPPSQCLAVIPRDPLRWALLQLHGVPQQLGEIVEGIGSVQFAGVYQAHEQIDYLLRQARVRSRP